MSTNRTREILAAAILVVTAASAFGCASGPRVYEPLTVAAFSKQDHRWQALQTMVTEEGWTVTRIDHRRGELTAVRANATAADMRERIIVQLENDETMVAVHTEMFMDGHWWGTAATCSTYSYARESALAQRLEASPPPGALAAR